MSRFLVPVFVALLLLPTASLLAQTGDKKFVPTYYFNGGVGAFLPTYNRQGLSLAALANVFNFEVDLKDHYVARFAVDLVNVPYFETGAVGGFAVTKKDRLGLSYLGLDLGYRHNRGKMGAYGYVGVGWVSVNVPQLRVNVPARQIDFESESGNFLNLRGGIGGEYRISNVFVPYLEACYSRIPFITPLNSKPISGITVLIGFRTPFQ